MPANASVQDMLAQYDRIPARIEQLKKLSGDDLAKVVSFFGVMQLPNVMYVSFLSNRSIHHRGQLSTYLRAMNAHVPSIYGGSADEPFEMPAGASSLEHLVAATVGPMTWRPTEWPVCAWPASTPKLEEGGSVAWD